MGLGDFLSGILGTQNNYHADPRQNTYQVNQGGYGSAAQQAILNSQNNQSAQGNYIHGLQTQVAGGGAPSIAQMLLQQQTQRNAQTAAGAIASQRGINPGLAQKLALDQAAQGNQQMAGQAAILRSQEQLGAQGLLGQALGQQGSQAGAQAASLGGLDLSAQGLAGGIAGQNAQLGLGADQINAGVAQQNAGTAGQLVGGLLGGVGAASTFAMPGAGGAGSAGGGAMMGGTGALPAGGVTQFGQIPLANQGGKVPGSAAVEGDSPKNDSVPAQLSPGEIVVPRSAAEDPDRAAAFVRAVIRQQKAKAGPQGYGAVLAKQRELEQRMKALEGRR